MLLVDEEVVEDEENEVGELQSIETSEEVYFPTTTAINSIVGLANPKTLKMVGTLGDGEVVVMVDPGATHNFISLRAVEKLGVPIAESAGFGVSLGNRESVMGKGVCKGVRMIVNGDIEIQEDFLPLELGNSYVILGIQWLEKLGPVVTNWKTQVMTYQVG